MPKDPEDGLNLHVSMKRFDPIIKWLISIPFSKPKEESGTQTSSQFDDIETRVQFSAIPLDITFLTNIKRTVNELNVVMLFCYRSECSSL